jgi:hypothetical protein
MLAALVVFALWDGFKERVAGTAACIYTMK